MSTRKRALALVPGPRMAPPDPGPPSDKSDDIRKLFTDTLDKVGVEWTTLARGSDPFNIPVARKASVTLMGTHVGPRH
ncbi:hypothetical protein [Streptomyces sp. NPDC051636]|uniref:hypothetical protein n=1 Tax=Streptomyces sp. NPDC051636 TaxID=3365663 RepID=UPI00379D0CB3